MKEALIDRSETHLTSTNFSTGDTVRDNYIFQPC